MLTTTYTFYDWTQQGGRLKQLRTTHSASTLAPQNLIYNYDAVGNLTTIDDAATFTATQTQNFTYDSLNRLTAGWTSGLSTPSTGAYNETYGYDALGNFTTKTAGVAVTANYTDTAHKHAVTTQSNGNLYQYDAVGNMTSRKENGVVYQQAWNAENLLTVVTNTATNEVSKFTYDGNGARVKLEALSGGTLVATTLYVGAIEVKITASGRLTNTYYANVAMRTATSGSDSLYFLIPDHLGSTSLVTNLTGYAYSRQLYHPYGTVRYTSTVALPTNHTYTGQLADAGTGLMYYNARYYHPGLGRFVSADTVVPGGNGSAVGPDDRMALRPLTVDFHETPLVLGLNAENAFTLQHGFWFQLSRKEKQQAKNPFGPSDPQALNRYAYVLNNPVRYTDPSGHWAIQVGVEDLAHLKTLFNTAKTRAGETAVWWGLAGGGAAGIISLIVGAPSCVVSGAVTLGAACLAEASGLTALTIGAAGLATEWGGGQLARNFTHITDYIDEALTLKANRGRESLEVGLHCEDLKCWFRIEGMSYEIQIDREVVVDVENMFGISAEYRVYYNLTH